MKLRSVSDLLSKASGRRGQSPLYRTADVKAGALGVFEAALELALGIGGRRYKCSTNPKGDVQRSGGRGRDGKSERPIAPPQQPDHVDGTGDDRDEAYDDAVETGPFDGFLVHPRIVRQAGVASSDFASSLRSPRDRVE